MATRLEAAKIRIEELETQNRRLWQINRKLWRAPKLTDSQQLDNLARSLRNCDRCDSDDHPAQFCVECMREVEDLLRPTLEEYKGPFARHGEYKRCTTCEAVLGRAIWSKHTLVDCVRILQSNYRAVRDELDNWRRSAG